MQREDFFGQQQSETELYVISFPTNSGLENPFYKMHKWIRVDSPNGIDLYISNSISNYEWAMMLYDIYGKNWFFGSSKHDLTALKSKLEKVVELSAHMRVLQGVAFEISKKID